MKSSLASLAPLALALSAACSSTGETDSDKHGDGGSGADPGPGDAPDIRASGGSNAAGGAKGSAGNDAETSTGGASTGGQPVGSGGGDGLPGPFVYSEYDEEGRFMIDTLFMITEKAYEEITVDRGTDPRSFLDYRIEEMNDALERSLVTSSRVRTLGYHIINDEDFMRTGDYPTDTLENLSYWQDWLSDYRATYGADKIILVSATEEVPGGAAWGGGDASSYYVDFLPIRHEFGHCMGGGHCNDGNSGSLQYGYPFGGYSSEGTPNSTSVKGGTAMCGNKSAFYSNPDLVLSQEQIASYIAEGVLPDQDYSSVVGPDGLRMGDPLYANMAQTWRDAEADAARRMNTTKYPGYSESFYEKDDCAGFYGEEGYGQFFYEICLGDERTDLIDLQISSVKLGRNVHVNLYSDKEFGAGSSCGGLIERLAFSSPSLGALSQHHGVQTIDNAVSAATVFSPLDREAHAHFKGQFSFYGTGDLPFCSTINGQTLTLMRDNDTFSGTAAVRTNELALPYVIQFDYWTQHDGDNHADGLVVFFGKDAAPYENGTAPPRESLGFIPDGTGVGVAFNIFKNTVSIRDGSFNSVQSTSLNTYTDGAWVAVQVEVTATSVAVFYDGAPAVSANIALGTEHSAMGFSVGTGAYTSEYRVRDVVITGM